MQVVVADTTPIRYLAEIDRLDLLPKLFNTSYIPDVVYRGIAASSNSAAGTRPDRNGPRMAEDCFAGEACRRSGADGS